MVSIYQFDKVIPAVAIQMSHNLGFRQASWNFWTVDFENLAKNSCDDAVLLIEIVSAS